MASILSLFGTIFIDNTKANESIDNTTKKAESSGSKVGSALSAIGKGAVAMGTALVTGTAAVATALVATAEGTREYRNEMAKLETAYTTAGHSATAAENTYRSLYSVLGETDQAVEASAHLAKLCQTEEELQSWTNICTGVYATFGNSLPIEGLTEAANETAKVGQLTGSLADALNWAGVSEDEFNAKLEKCSSEQERQQLITETLTGLYSEAADTYKELNGDILSASSVTIEANRINLTAYLTSSEVADVAEGAADDAIGGIVLEATNGSTSSKLSLLNGSAEICSATIKFTGVVSFSDLQASGQTVINGDNIKTGTIAATYIETDNLSCTRLYGKGSKAGYFARMSSGIGDFGIYAADAADNDNPRNDTCLLGMYNTDPSGELIKIYSFGNSILDTESGTTTPRGTWDLSKCTLTGLSATNQPYIRIHDVEGTRFEAEILNLDFSTTTTFSAKVYIYASGKFNLVQDVDISSGDVPNLVFTSLPKAYTTKLKVEITSPVEVTLIAEPITTLSS